MSEYKEGAEPPFSLQVKSAEVELLGDTVFLTLHTFAPSPQPGTVPIRLTMTHQVALHSANRLDAAGKVVLLRKS